MTNKLNSHYFSVSSVTASFLFTRSFSVWINLCTFILSMFVSVIFYPSKLLKTWVFPTTAMVMTLDEMLQYSRRCDLENQSAFDTKRFGAILFYIIPDKGHFSCSKLLILPLNPIVWVLKRIVSVSCFFWVPTT